MKLPFSDVRRRAEAAERARKVTAAEVEEMHAQAAVLQDALREARQHEVEVLEALCLQALEQNKGVLMRYENRTLVSAQLSDEVPPGEIHELHVTKVT